MTGILDEHLFRVDVAYAARHCCSSVAPYVAIPLNAAFPDALNAVLLLHYSCFTDSLLQNRVHRLAITAALLLLYSRFTDAGLTLYLEVSPWDSIICSFK
jgi:hypothetical protein